MAWAIASVAQATPSSTSPITVTYTGVVGRLYALFLSRASAADPFTTVTDSASNTWTRQTYAPTSGTTGRRIELWTLVPGTSFTSISVAFTGTGTAQATLVEITGHDTTFINQVTSDFRASSTAPTPVLTVTPTVANTLIVCAVQANNNTNAQITSSAGWTRLNTHTNGPAIAYKANATNGVADGTTWTFTTAVGSGHVVVAFAPSAAAGLTVYVWNGTSEVAATVEGVWNGTTVTPATLDVIST